MKTLSIDGYHLGEFCKLVAESLDNGWKFDFDTNENYPVAYGSFYHAVLIKEDSAVMVKHDNTPEEVVQETSTETKNKPGRKSKTV